MTNQDLIGLVVSYAYATGLLALAEIIRRLRGYPQDFTRKIVHIGAGMWVFGVLALFDTWYIGVIPFATFIGINYLLYRFRFLEAVDASDSSPGTVYFAFSITVLFLLFWRTDSPADRGYIAAAGTMAMTWGDALAAIIGRRFGKRTYVVNGATRTWEGSLAMFGAAATAMFLTILLVPGSALGPLTPPLSVPTALTAAITGAGIATAAEAVSPAGTDNISVPILAGFSVFAIVTLLG